jgi:hypothetical protein
MHQERGSWAFPSIRKSCAQRHVGDAFDADSVAMPATPWPMNRLGSDLDSTSCCLPNPLWGAPSETPQGVNEVIISAARCTAAIGGIIVNRCHFGLRRRL